MLDFKINAKKAEMQKVYIQFENSVKKTNMHFQFHFSSVLPFVYVFQKTRYIFFKKKSQDFFLITNISKVIFIQIKITPDVYFLQNLF